MAPTSFPPVKQATRVRAYAEDHGKHGFCGDMPATQRLIREMPAPKALGFHIGSRPKTEQSRWRMRCTCSRRACLCSAPFPDISARAGAETIDGHRGKEKMRKVRLKGLMDPSLSDEPQSSQTVGDAREKSSAPSPHKQPDPIEGEECNTSSSQVPNEGDTQLRSVSGRRMTQRKSTRTQKLVAKFTAKMRSASPKNGLTSIGEDDVDNHAFQQSEELPLATDSKLTLRNSLRALDQLRITAAFGSHSGSAKSNGDSANSGELNRAPVMPGIGPELQSFMQGAFQASCTRRSSEASFHAADIDKEHSVDEWIFNRSGSLGSERSMNANDNGRLCKPKTVLSDRLKRVELRRSEKMKSIRDQRAREMKKRRYNALPKHEGEAIERAFRQFDKEKKGYIDRNKIIPCLQELGICGKTMEERLALKQSTECPVEGCSRPPCNWQPGQPCCRTCQQNSSACHDADCDHLFNNTHNEEPQTAPVAAHDPQTFAMTIFLNEINKTSEQPTNDDDEAMEALHGNALSLHDFALTVVPHARQKLLELRSSDMLKQFFQFDDDGSGQLSREECKQLAGRLGLDQRMVDSLCDKEDEVDFEHFQQLIAKGKEKVDRMVRTRERAIQAQLGINDNLFDDFRNDLASLYQLFEMYDVDESGALSMNEVMCMIKEFGLQPKTAQEREEINYVLERNDVNGDGEFNFVEFLELVREVRAYTRAKKQEEYLMNFERYDKDKSGTLSVLEISNLLADLGFVPKSYREQDELALLIHTADDDASGYINFNEFQVLCQRIDEKLKSMRYEEEIEYAMKLGFGEQHIRDLRWIFDSLDTDGSRKLDVTEVRSALIMMRKNVSCEVFNNAFSSLDSDGSGELDFLEFMQFMQLMRDSEGLFSDDTQKIASNVKYLDSRVLKRVLEHFHLSKNYINSLDKADLASLFCDFLGVSDGSNLQEALGISTIGELFELVRHRTESQTHKGSH